MRFALSARTLCHAFHAIVEFVASNAFGAKFAPFKLMIGIAASPITRMIRFALRALGAFLAIRTGMRALYAFGELVGFSQFFATQTPTHDLIFN